jgi:hypothetical protein
LRMQVGEMQGSKISNIRVRRVTEIAEVTQ